jgi:3-oxoacyl-[acyl-carrier-protein] synthase-3
MNDSIAAVTAHLLRRLNEVMQRLGMGPAVFDNPDTRFADAFDSMAMVEFLEILAEDYGVTASAIEECVNRRFGTVAELAARLHAARWAPRGQQGSPGTVAPAIRAAPQASLQPCWLAATAARLPEATQSAACINEALKRPPGWLERHAGIQERRVWGKEDPLAAAAEAAYVCLDRAGLSSEKVGTLLVTSEAPPMLTGLAAALHHRLRLQPNVVALEIGGACTGFLNALWTGQALLHQKRAILVIAVEAPTRYLHLQPGPAGENAALFGDAAAAALLCGEPQADEAVPLAPVLLGVDGSGTGLLQVDASRGAPELHMRRIKLASRAVEAMAGSVSELASRHGLPMSKVAAVVAHGGNGRLPGLLARKLGLPPDRVWSETSRTGNLGSASLPVAWASRHPQPRGPVIWTAVGAGLTWGAAITGQF